MTSKEQDILAEDSAGGLKNDNFNMVFERDEHIAGFDSGFDKCMELVVSYLEDYKAKGHTLYFDERELFSLLIVK